MHRSPAILLLSLLVTASAQAAERRFAVGDFDRILLAGSTRVDVRVGPETMATASGEATDLDRLDIRVRNRALHGPDKRLRPRSPQLEEGKGGEFGGERRRQGGGIGRCIGRPVRGGEIAPALMRPARSRLDGHDLEIEPDLAAAVRRIHHLEDGLPGDERVADDPEQPAARQLSGRTRAAGRADSPDPAAVGQGEREAVARGREIIEAAAPEGNPGEAEAIAGVGHALPCDGAKPTLPQRPADAA